MLCLTHLPLSIHFILVSHTPMPITLHNASRSSTRPLPHLLYPTHTHLYASSCLPSRTPAITLLSILHYNRDCTHSFSGATFGTHRHCRALLYTLCVSLPHDAIATYLFQ